MLLRWLQKTGHKPITLMGGGTTKVGDPSGPDERSLLGARRDRRQHRLDETGLRALHLDMATGHRRAPRC
jgi:tyrosyl-tRNA synthetase